MVKERASEECLTFEEAFIEGYAQGRADAIDECIKFVDEWDSVIADALARNMKEQNIK